MDYNGNIALNENIKDEEGEEKGKNTEIKKFSKDTKILMNQKVQTAKNFFLNFPEQKNQLQEKFKEIDAINFNSSDNQKIQEIIKSALFQY